MTAYWIAHVTVLDPEAYQGYQALAPEAFQKYGGRFLARGGSHVSLEGAPFERHVVIEFPDLDTAKACYNLPEYQTAAAKRKDAAKAQITLVEGL